MLVSMLATALAADWNVLQTDQVLVRCRPAGDRNLCEASARLDVPPDAVRASIEDLEHYPERFISITAAHRDPSGRILLAFQLPWMLGAFTATTVPSAWSDPNGWHLHLDVVEAHGRTHLFEALTFDVAPTEAGAALTIRWTHTLGWPAAVRDRITRQQGHNLVWGIALGAAAEPTTTGIATATAMR